MKIKNISIVTIVVSLFIFLNCDAINKLIEDEVANMDNAGGISFVSEYGPFELVPGSENLDQASLPWVMGAFVFTVDVEGFDVPVLRSTDDEPILVDITITTEGGDLPGGAGNRSAVQVFVGTDVETEQLDIGDIFGVPAKVPDASPILSGKTIIPQYFFIDITQFEWGAAIDTLLSNMNAAFDKAAGGDPTGGGTDLVDAVFGAADLTPAPWFCETVKVTISYTREDGKKISGIKEIEADPQMIVDLLAAGGGAMVGIINPLLQPTPGFDLSGVSDALEDLASGQGNCQ
jgi:hypothetical protein